MGSPLGPVLANIFMCYLEENAIDNYTGEQPSVYRRYVDDTFLIFYTKEDSIAFFDFLNTQNDNIKFTKEDEDNNMLSFLDVLVTRVDGTLCTSVYRKRTFSGLFMKYDSFVPIQCKRSLVYGLINRSWKICSSVESFENEVKFLKNILGANGYPYKFISRQINKFIKSKQNSNSQLPIGPEKKSVFLLLPFCGDNSTKLQKQLIRIMGKVAPWTRLQAIFKPSYKLNVLSKLKSQISLLNKSNVVYKLDCEECEEFYIGQTTRRLKKRIQEHKTKEFSSVYRHSSITYHKFNFDSPVILAADTKEIRLKVKESLLIREYSAHQSLNVKIQSLKCKLW